MKPFAESCEQNKQPILEVLRQQFASTRKVLEIGSGTGQHAVYFARHLPHLTWTASDVSAQHEGIHAWFAEDRLPNLQGPLLLDVKQASWPEVEVDGIFSANTTHIMDWPGVTRMFIGIGSALTTGGIFCLYGPFNCQGRYTSESNARFDAWLKQRDPASGIRDQDELDTLAKQQGLTLRQDIPMPANNRILVWEKLVTTQ